MKKSMVILAVMQTVMLTVSSLRPAAASLREPPTILASADVRSEWREERVGNWVNIAHRGASGYAPENTMASFQKAFEMGADMLELDVQLSRDGHVVVIHDSDVERTSNGQGEVGALSLQELKSLDVGAWYHPDYAGETIPTLDEVMERFGGEIGLLIELKLPSRYPGIEEKVADVLKRKAPAASRLRDTSRMIMVQSADTDSLRRFHELMPEIPLGIVATSSKELSKERLQEFSSYADYMNVSVKLVSRSLIRKIHEAGMKTFVWTIRDVLQIPFLMESGVDGIITDYPDRVPVSYLNHRARS